MHQPIDATRCRINPLDYLPLLKKRARRFVNLGLDLEDLIQVGYIGLNRAAEKYDSDLSKGFHVYARWWIDQTIKRAIQSQGSTVRVPCYILDGTIKPGQNLAKRQACEDAAARFKNRRASAYFAADSEDGEGHPLDVRNLPDPGPCPAEDAARRSEIEKLIRCLDRLPAHTAEILRLRFGIGCEPHTQAAIAAKYGFHRMSMHPMQKTALARLRALMTRDRRIGA